MTETYIATDRIPFGEIVVGSRVHVPVWSSGRVVRWADGTVTEITLRALANDCSVLVDIDDAPEALYFPWSIGRIPS